MGNAWLFVTFIDISNTIIIWLYAVQLNTMVISHSTKNQFCQNVSTSLTLIVLDGSTCYNDIFTIIKRVDFSSHAIWTNKILP